MTKTDIYGGKRPRDLPLYGIAEAAKVVNVHPATLRSWVLGRARSARSQLTRWTPLIRIADPELRRLSFTNLVEVHVLSSLRDKRVRVEGIRSAANFIRRELNTDHPLADINVNAQTDCIDIYVEYLGRLVDVSTSQTDLRSLVELSLLRIDRDESGLATRLFPARRDHALDWRAVVVDPLYRFGRPILASTSLETAVVADRFLAGESIAALAADFAIDEAMVEKAIRFETQLRAA